MNRIFSFGALALLVILFWIALPVQAEGWYVSGELGMNFGESLDLEAYDNDRASLCDEYINPNYANTAVGGTVIDCTSPRTQGDAWEVDFGSDDGILLGAALGYRMRASRFRTELEYFYRDTGYDETSGTVLSTAAQTVEKVEGELTTLTDRIGSLTSHNLFVNLYADFANDSKFTPYVGVGVGFGFTELKYGGVTARNTDPGEITSVPDGITSTPGTDQIRQNLASTTTTESEELDDTLFGYQLILGVDYALTESLQLGVKGRWVHFDAFQDGDAWDQLRSHPSNLRRDGSEPVEYSVRVDDIEMFGVSVNLKYRF